MSIEKITSKILNEAEESKEAILAEAAAKRDAILAEAEKKAGELTEAEKARGLAEKEKTVTRRKSVADIDCRKVVLQRKQELIAECFEEAADEITAMNEADYIKLLVALGTSAGAKEGQLIFNEKERAGIGQRVADALSEAISGGKFTLSEETRNIKGGFLLKTGQVYINNTIEELVEESKEELTSEVARMLFQE